MPKNITGKVITETGQPMPNVAVTNGRDVTRTDSQGRYALETAGPFVTLTRPTGWHSDQWFVRVDTASAESRDITFTLAPSEQTLPYQFMHITDTHLNVAGHPKWSYDKGRLTEPDQLREFLQDLPRLSPKTRSVVITGDLVDHGDPAEFAGLMEAVADAPVPVHLVPGNHDHMDEDVRGVVSRNNYLTNTGSPERYEHFVGPRWYSYDVAGLHVVALDWHTHELGLDHAVQEEWLRNDLAAATDMPYILVMHDQPASYVMTALPRRPLATFSGHWHTSRVVSIDDVLHVNSPTPFFAGLDYSPPSFREVTWDGTAVTLNTRTLPARYLHNPEHVFDTEFETDKATLAAPRRTPRKTADVVRWRHQLQGAGHRAGLTYDGATIFAGSQVEDRAEGTVEAIDAETGERLWLAGTEAAVKTRPLKADTVVVAAAVNGDVIGLDAATGDRLWTTPSTDPYRRFAWGSPTEAEGIVVLGDQSDLRALDVRTGKVLWRRTDLSPHHNIVTHASVLIVGRLVMVGFWPTPHSPIAVDLHTGADIWARPNLTGEPWTAGRALRVTGTAVLDEHDDALLVPAISSTAKLDRATGRMLWSAPHEGGYSPSTPVVTDLGYVVTVTGHGVRLLDRTTGEQLWDCPVEGLAPFPMTAYRMKAHPVMAAPTPDPATGTLLLPGLDGRIHRIALDGRILSVDEVGVPLAAPLVAAGGHWLTVAVDGGVLSLDLTASTERNPQ